MEACNIEEQTCKHNQRETTYNDDRKRICKHNQWETKKKYLDWPVVGFEGYRYWSDMIGQDA